MAHEKSRKTGIFVIGLFVIVCTGLLWCVFDWRFAESKTYLSYIIYPFLVVQRVVGEPIKQWYTHRATIDELRARVHILEQERDDAQEALVMVSARDAYAQDIKEVVESKHWYNMAQVVLAQVLLRNFSDQEHFFFVDVGSNHAIEKNMVAVYKNNIIGRVVEVFPSYSKVILVSDRTCNIAVYCARSRATGIYEGTNVLDQGLVNHVSHLYPVTTGELVISSGDGMVFPQGFALGAVTSVTSNSLVYTITTKPLCDIRTIRYCYLVQK